MNKKKIALFGGAGFVGSQMVRTILENGTYDLVVVDILTYAGTRDNFPSNFDLSHFYHENICNPHMMDQIFNEEKPDYVINMAAESHVDNSITNATPFIKTNVLGTQILLDCAVKYGVEKFIQISTDEVYGGFQQMEKPDLTHSSPSSPYASSKASADLLVLSYHKTHGLPVVITRCCNNFGPRQHEEKFIPTVIKNLLVKKRIPVYGDGKNVRQWIYVEDHCNGILKIMNGNSKIAHFGSVLRITNLELIYIIYNILKEKKLIERIPVSYFIEFIEDRKGHDRNYWLNDQSTMEDFDLIKPLDFKEPFKETVQYYLEKWKSHK